MKHATGTDGRLECELSHTKLPSGWRISPAGVHPQTERCLQMSMSASTQPVVVQRPALWRRVLAAVLDFICVFFIAGYVVGYLTGNLTSDGFKLEGAPALIVFAAIALYFVVLGKFFGGTVWQRVLRAR